MSGVNEGSTSYHTVTFYDVDGNLITPDSITYTLLDASENTLVDWTSVVPGSSVEIQITGANNTISSTTGKKRKLTVKGVNPDSTVITEEENYTINSFSGIK